MKKVQIFLLLVLGITFFTSCKKEKQEVVISKTEAAGLYEGKYGTGNNNPSTFYSFRLKEDGTMEELGSDGSLKGTGTWTLTGNQFTATHKYIFPANAFFVTTGTYDGANKKISGTWGYGSSNNDGGKWHMTKK